MAVTLCCFVRPPPDPDPMYLISLTTSSLHARPGGPHQFLGAQRSRRRPKMPGRWARHRVENQGSFKLMIRPLIRAIARPVVRTFHPLVIHYLKLRGFSVVAARPDYFYSVERLATCGNHDFVDDPRFRNANECCWCEPCTRTLVATGR